MYEQLVVPESMRNEILSAHHDDLVGGNHLGMHRTYQKLLPKYYWEGMYTDCRNWCRSCIDCGTKKQGAYRPPAPLQPIPTTRPYYAYHCDVLGPLPETYNGNKYVIIFIDRFTKFPEAFPTRNQTAVTVAKLFMTEIVCRYSAPVELVTDNATNFQKRTNSRNYQNYGHP